MTISRRKFIAQAGLFTAAASFSRFGFCRTNAADIPDVAAIDRTRILSAANRYLRKQPITITSYSSPRSAGGKHDYFSEGDYW